MARLIEEQIIAEDTNTVTIRFTRRNGKFIDKTVNKIDGMTNEQLLTRWHRRMTLEFLQRRIRLSQWQSSETSVV